MNRAEVNIGGWILVGTLGTYIYFSWGNKYPGVGLLGYVVSMCL